MSGREPFDGQSLVVEFVGHREEDRPHALIVNPTGEAPAMLGMTPKLEWIEVHAAKTHSG